MINFSIVVAMSNNRAIGANNQLLWHLPNDLKHFKNVTISKPIVMGRKTFESIGRPLPGRDNIVITSDNNFLDKLDLDEKFKKNIIVYNSIDNFVSDLDKNYGTLSFATYRGLHPRALTAVSKRDTIIQDSAVKPQKVAGNKSNIKYSDNKLNQEGQDSNIEIMIIGGGEIYKQFLPLVNKIYLTVVDAEFEADVFFPELDDSWQEVSVDHHSQDEKHKYNYSFIELNKKFYK